VRKTGRRGEEKRMEGEERGWEGSERMGGRGMCAVVNFP